MEKALVAWLQRKFSHASPPVEIGIGDDAAVIQCPGPLVVATDTIADGTHFDMEQHDLTLIGHKAIAVNLSDIAAMGARPFAATINLNCPQDFDLGQAKRLIGGIADTAQKFDTVLIGGDTNRWDGPLVITITVLGRRFADQHNEFWRKDSAHSNDVILVSGDFGGSISGKHLQFEPRIELARYLVAHYSVSACTDVSDSLAMDLSELASASRLGFNLRASDIPISQAAAAAQDSKMTNLQHALYDGEDFELIIAMRPAHAAKAVADPLMPVALTAIGNFNETGKFQMVHSDSLYEELTIRGYEH